MGGSSLHRKGMRKLEIILVHFTFLAGTVDADDTRGRRRRKKGKEVGNEAGTNIITKGDGVF